MNNDRIAVSYEGQHSYSIVLRDNFEGLKEELKELNSSNRKLCIVTETRVGALYNDELTRVLSACAGTVVTFTFLEGEVNKNLDTVRSLYTFLIEQHFDRNDILVALGGGVVGDLTGYAAATYLRGIRFIQVPTSLLAMSDSSLGGKTGVDFDSYKNMIGSFHMPKLVYMNLVTLCSLGERQYLSGFGEVVKHGLIKDKSYFLWLKDNHEFIKARDYEMLQFLVRRNCEIKKEVVELDPKELGERALLNFGHTLGHAIERLKDFSLLHGECVALGMVAAAYISCKRGMITRQEFEEIITVLELYSLPVQVTGLTLDAVLAAAAHDKKKDGKELKFILLADVGHAVIDTSVTNDEMRDAVEFLLRSNV